MIHEFNPQVYPCRLWVSINPSYKEFSDMFYGLSIDMEKNNVSKEDFKHNKFKIATTSLVCDKKDGWIGCLVSIWKPKIFSVKDVCHESVHCADFVFEKFGIKHGGFDEGEAYAYFIGWVSECINNVKKRKIR